MISLQALVGTGSENWDIFQPANQLIASYFNLYYGDVSNGRDDFGMISVSGLQSFSSMAFVCYCWFYGWPSISRLFKLVNNLLGTNTTQQKSPIHVMSSEYQVLEQKSVTVTHILSPRDFISEWFENWQNCHCSRLSLKKLSNLVHRSQSNSSSQLNSSSGPWAVLQLPCCPSKQGELSENILQHLSHDLMNNPVQFLY